ncbi:alpha/beta hydrolase family protein [Pseudovibrio ascidiaceicola]|uniref:alpha/beta hydrolase family protein n=1 Tax=Pseudovibrio ascidiaceicola TaxID=285279 RepID=UPI000D6939E7|nr:alpha/beta hydrolase [Pseudovibrio ascidiaceicola]
MSRRHVLASLAALMATVISKNGLAANPKEGLKALEDKIKEYGPGMEALMQGTSYPPHCPILRTPADYGMEFENIFLNVGDSLKVKGWFIPAASDRLIISNHFSPGSKYGYPGHLDEFSNPAGEINFIPRYKALHDAGYNILTYDTRGHGESPDDVDGATGLGQKEWEEVVASLEFARSNEQTSHMKIGMMNICMGGNSAMVAMKKRPEMFKDVICQMLLQPFDMRIMVEKGFASMGMDPATVMPVFEELYREKTGFEVDDHDMRKYANAIKIPTFVVQVRNDSSTNVSYVEDIYNALSVEDKKMYWIEDTPHRFVAYQYFSDHPEQMLEWFNARMS